LLAQESSARAVEFSKDGMNMYILGTLSDTVYQYTLTTPWQVDTASYASKSLSVAAKDNFPTALRFKSDGTKFYVIGQQNDFLVRIFINNCLGPSNSRIYKQYSITNNNSNRIIF